MRIGVDGEELPEWDTDRPRHEERRGTKSDDVARGEHDLDPVSPVSLDERLGPFRSQYVSHRSPGKNLKAPMVSDPIEDDVAGEHADEADRQSELPAHHLLVREHATCDDDGFLRNGNAKASR